MVKKTVQDGRDNGVIGNHLVPLGESLVNGKRGGGFLILSGNELKNRFAP